MSTVVQEDVRSVVQRVGRAFQKLDGKKFLIAGGTGFIGSHLLETIAFLNDEVLGKSCQAYSLGRHPERFSQRLPHLTRRKDIVLLQGDIRTFKAPTDSFDFVIHAASPAVPQILTKNPLEAMEVIVEGTRRVLGLASEKRVDRFLFLSSGAVYGPQPPALKAIPEDYQGGPDLRNERAGYGEAKRYAEALCRAFRASRDVPVLVARLFAFVGPYMDFSSSFAVTDFIRQGLLGETIRIKGDGKAVRTLCYSADMVVAIWKILLLAETGEIFNVGSDREAVSISELAHKVAGKMNPPGKVCLEGHGNGDSDRPRYVPDLSRLKTLGFSALYDLDMSLERTIRHLLEGNCQGIRQ